MSAVLILEKIIAQIKVLQMEVEKSRQDGQAQQARQAAQAGQDEPSEQLAQVKQAELPEGEAQNSLPLPCHFFDYMIGTSAGG